MRLTRSLFCWCAFRLWSVLQLASGQQLTAVKKLSFDSSEKLLAEDLAFAPLLAPNLGEDGSSNSNQTLTSRSAAYTVHRDDTSAGLFQRAIEVFDILGKRSSCPSDFSDCGSIGAPNKCCKTGTYCSHVEDSTVGHVACCVDGATCGGAVGQCPSDAVTCPSTLGGGCCIAGYVCQGDGCVPSASATPVTETNIQSVTKAPDPDTITVTQTTVINDDPTTVIVTKTAVLTSTGSEITETTTVRPESPSSDEGSQTGQATGGAPYRPVSSATEVTKTTASSAEPTQTGCPTGFYGCLATHGGGCCRTDRDCQTHDCPAASSTTLVSDGVTIVVPITDVPASTTATCGDGWSLCGSNAGPVPGCCPSGYDCGTASCFTVTASQTAKVQKEFPTKDSGGSLSKQRRGVLAGGFALIFLQVMR